MQDHQKWTDEDMLLLDMMSVETINHVCKSLWIRVTVKCRERLIHLQIVISFSVPFYPNHRSRTALPVINIVITILQEKCRATAAQSQSRHSVRLHRQQ